MKSFATKSAGAAIAIILAAGTLAAVQRGGTAFEQVYGDRFFAYLARHPEQEASFQASMSGRAEQEAGDDGPALTATEVPLLYETGADRRFDVVVVITAPEETRRKRRPLTDDREQRLLPEAEKVALADYAYVNDGTLAELDAFVDAEDGGLGLVAVRALAAEGNTASRRVLEDLGFTHQGRERRAARVEGDTLADAAIYDVLAPEVVKTSS